MIRKIMGKTAILCVGVAVTIMLVVAAWVVTSRFSRKTAEPVTPVDKSHPAEQRTGGESTLVESAAETGIAEDSSSNAKAKKDAPADTGSQFHQIEQDFAAGSSNIRQLGKTKPNDVGIFKKEKAENTAPGSDQPLTIKATRDADINRIRREAGQIVDRSGLFSADTDSDREDLVSTAERDHGISIAEANPDGEIPKDTKARRAVVLERRAYQEAKVRVDAMLRSLGYLDEI